MNRVAESKSCFTNILMQRIFAFRIRKGQLKFMGHVIGKESLENLTVTCHIEGKRLVDWLIDSCRLFKARKYV